MSDHSTFADRHIGLDSQAVATMLAVIGVDSLDDLAVKAVPAGILDTLTDTGAAPGLDSLPPAASEAEALAELRALADANTVAVSMIGQGYYDTHTPRCCCATSSRTRPGIPPTRRTSPRLVRVGWKPC